VFQRLEITPHAFRDANGDDEDGMDGLDAVLVVKDLLSGRALGRDKE
jgi:hypothetical protein